MTRILVVCVAGVALTAVPGLCQTNHCSLTCFGTRPGETAPEIARRLTGSANNVDELWFQIYDPASNRFLPKAEYGALQPGWRACLLAARIDSAELPRQVAPEHDAYDSRIRRVADMPEAWWALSCLVAVLVTWETLAVRFAPSRTALVTAMTGFGHRFVGEFERPLRRAGSTTLPLDSRLRPQPARRRLDILLAPHVGRSYPNLADHRTNVEYDVGRVMRQLGDNRFVAERLFTNGRWVVVRCSVRMDLADGGET
jgi:hypothetical protein